MRLHIAQPGQALTEKGLLYEFIGSISRILNVIIRKTCNRALQNNLAWLL